MNRAYSRSLWAAAFVIGDGGCGDDGFMDFRSTLISMGRTAFERALDDPETLVDVVPPGGNLRHEGFQAVALHVAARLSRDGELDRARGSHNFLEPPSGEDWDEFTVWDMYPRLTKRFSPD
jgi:hypothetical protein